MMRLFYKILLSLIFISGILLAQTPAQLMETGNKYYQNDDWKNAVETYQKILKQGYESAPLYYNLGNAYFKSDQLGYAILNYERALKLDPGSEDIEFNLKVANARTVDNIKAVPQIFIIEWWNVLVSALSVSGWLMIVLIFYLLLLTSIGIYFLSRKINLQKLSIYTGIVSLVLLIVSSLLLFALINKETTSHYGILTTNIVSAKVSPDEQSNDAFVIHEGLKFELQDKVDNWTKIKLSDGKVGWLPSNTFGKI